MTFINTEQVCKISKYKNSICYRYRYQPYKKTWFSTQKEGFVKRLLSSKFYTFDEIDKERYVIKDNKVYWKPFLELTMSNGEVVSKYFETAEELEKAFIELVMKTDNLTITKI